MALCSGHLYANKSERPKGRGSAPARVSSANWSNDLNQDASAWTEPAPTALLVLADGTVLEGFGFGATGHAVGEVCFNTAPPSS